METIFDAMEEEEKKPVVKVDLGLVSDLVQAYHELEEKIASATDHLQRLNKRKEEMLREDIPTAMAGLKKVVTDGGETISVVSKAFVRLIAKHSDEYYQWLRDTGKGDIIKDSPVVIPTGDGSLYDLFEELKEKYPSYEFSVLPSVHANTTKALIRRLKEAGEDYPAEYFNIFEFEEAVIKKPRKKRKK